MVVSGTNPFIKATVNWIGDLQVANGTHHWIGSIWYKDGAGTCFCDKKAKCGCPGDCEPKGCDEKREQQMKKEIEAETRKAAEADRRHKSTTVEVKADKTVKPEAPAKPEPAGKKLSAAEVKQLGKLLDGYLRQHPDARTRNAEDLRNELR